MVNRLFNLSYFILAAGVIGLYRGVFISPASMWREHIYIAAILLGTVAFLMLTQRHRGEARAFLGALVFVVFPGHAYALAKGGGWAMPLWYLCSGLVASGLAAAVYRMYIFLTTQESLIRYIFIAAVAALVAGLMTVTFQINGAWQREETLWRWRMAQGGGAKAVNALIHVLEKDRSNVNPALDQEIIDLYNQSLSLNPRQEDIYVRYASLLEQQGKRIEAMNVYNAAIRQIPDAPESYLRLASIYEEQRKPEKVIELFNALLKRHPDDESICLKVLNAYNAAVSRHPQGSIYQEKREEILALYEQLTKRKGYTANDFFNLGLLYEQVSGFDEAIRFYRKALDLQPNHEKALTNLASRYQAAGDVKAAVSLYERLVRFYPKSPEGYLKLGILMNALGEADKARYLYQKVIGIDSGNAEAYFNLGYLNESAGELREALADYEKAVDSNPQHAEAYYNMGNVYAALEQYPEAIASYLKTVGINPAHQNAFVNLSILSFKSRDFAGAIHYLEEAKRLGYTPPEAYLKTLDPYRKK